MRTLTVSLLAGLSSLGVPAAQAADLDYGVLRGPEYETVEPAIDWSGVYVGGHVGITSTSQKYPNTFGQVAADYFSKTPEDFFFRSAAQSAVNSLNVFEKRTSDTGYGVYLGYNFQFDETVLGFEFDYTKLDALGKSQDTINTSFLENGLNRRISLNVNGTASTELLDYGTARVRAGYAIGSFLPFVTGGLAIGRARVGQQVAINASDPAYNRLISDRNVNGSTSTFLVNAGLGSYYKTKVVAGLALGAGLEYALTQNIVLRGEYQYILFDAFDGTANSNASVRGVNVNTVRGGAAVKF
ncbi:MAG: outer membrane beta-barrel protein [Methylobacterium sp.]|uniref:outer membrane protein n=1 Tax=Methylobacterium sp. TaxID=409 RepID=UPI0025F7549D|nr:outer membrane beta-barrel protein [Methylobacterium sp.]MBX9930451.1 outer membrane beta-barrel protein [Methylobacterium sp.]